MSLTYKKQLVDNSAKMLRTFCNQYSISNQPGSDFATHYPQITAQEGEKIISFHKDFEKRDKKFQDFLKDRILNSLEVQRMDGMGNYIIRGLYKAFLNNPRQLPDETIFSLFKSYDPNGTSDWADTDKIAIGKMRHKIGSPNFRKEKKFQIALLRTTCDYVAGMTDNYAINEYQQLFGHSPIE